jgi:3-hydroxyacyl-CoA dehydrogenase / enoyl-CoA hydratase / 3-hydroxybutyryl-CoA epimerase
MITTGRVLSAVDLNRPDFLSVCPSESLLSEAMEWVRSRQGVINRNHDPDYREPQDLPDQEKAEIIRRARARFTMCPYRPAYAAALDALEAGLSLPFDEAAANEIDLFVPLFESPNTRNKIDLFFLTTSVAPRLVKVDRGCAAVTDSIAVIGAGLMGQGIAQIAADKGIGVTLVDVNEKASQAAIGKIEHTVDGLVTKGRWSKQRKDKLMNKLAWTTDYSDLKEIPLVIECVFEDVPLKQKILARVQEVNPDAIFASNTSTIPMALIAEGAVRPEQVVGMHFFSPVPLMPLLEVIQGPQSTVESVATAVTAGRVMGKTVILVGDGPGFYTSRTFGAYITTGFRLAELGLSPWDVDMMALQVGFPQGPLHLYGTAGGNIVYHAGKLMAEAFPNRLKLPESLPKLHAAGYVGGGSPGFYLDERKLIPDESVLEHLTKLEGLPTPSREEAQDILLLSMVNEAFWCLSDSVLKDYYSMDLGAVLGIGFPDCWHGPARFVSLRGVKAVKTRLAELADKFQIPSLTPAPEFDRLIACGLDSHLI